MLSHLLGKEEHIINAIQSRYKNISDITLSERSEETMLFFDAKNDLYGIPCRLKTDGRLLWIETLADNWIEVGEIDIDSHIPAEEEPIFIDIVKALDVINGYNFTQEQLSYYVAVLLSSQRYTEEETINELESIKVVFDEMMK